MRDDVPADLTMPLPGLIVRQARQARMHGLVPAMPSVIRVETGIKEVLMADQPLRVTAGQFVLLPESAPMTICNIPDSGGLYTARVVMLPRPVIERAMARLPNLVRPREKAPVLITALPPAAEALFDSFFSASMVADLPGHLIELRLEEMALWLALAGAALAPDGPERQSDRLRALIAADPAARWSSAQAARLLAVSQATLRRRLAAEHTSFGALLRDVRLTHALGLLQTTGFSVARIAEEAGYASPQQFAVRFRARFGFAPHEIRLPQAQIDRIGAEAAQAGAELAGANR